MQNSQWLVSLPGMRETEMQVKAPALTEQGLKPRSSISQASALTIELLTILQGFVTHFYHQKNWKALVSLQ